MRWLWLSAALVIAANAWVLWGVARNRAAAESRIDFSPSEYHMVRYGEENSGVAIRLNMAPPRPFDRSKAQPVRRVPGRSAFAVLERRADPSGLAIRETGESPAELRRRFPDASRYPIMRAIVRPWGTEVVNPSVHVPLPFSRTLLSAGQHSVTVCFGRNYEPWICDVR